MTRKDKVSAVHPEVQTEYRRSYRTNSNFDLYHNLHVQPGLYEFLHSLSEAATAMPEETSDI